MSTSIEPMLAPLALGVPLALALAAAVPSRSGVLQRLALGMSGLCALSLALVVALAGAPPVLRWLPGPLAEPGALRVDGVSVLVVGFVGLVGAVLWRFSGSYLRGDAGLARYRRSLLLTLACVTGLVLSNHLLVIGACWTGTSLALHQLLTYFRDRREAQLAAHKKFLASRLADLCLLGVAAALYAELGTLSLDRIDAVLADVGATPVLQVAGVLLVATAALKSAQLPFHGWLTQVMEAPTPVSALLHAGVVNMGAVVLLRLSGLLAMLPVAQTLLVVIGTTTAVVASLVWSTRVSVKVSLAWSTTAQMGFMLLQCGLGAWPLALLHLVAHSLYKAHAFLATGSTVDRARIAQLAEPPPPPSLGRWIGSGALGLLVAAVTAWLLGADPSHEPSLWVLVGIVGLAVAPLLVEGRGIVGWSRALGASVAVAGLYVGWHGLFVQLVPSAPGPWLPLQLGFVAVAFAGGFVAQALLRTRPGGAFARAVGPALFAGLYLDAWFTRLTFHVWPPRLDAPPPRSLHLVRTSEIR